MIEIGPLQESEVEEAHRICKRAFGTFLGLPDPDAAFGDRGYIIPRFRAGNSILAARDSGKLIGSNVLSRWGSFGFFGPLTVLPEHWDQDVGKRLLEATMQIFDEWGVRHSGLFTFAASAKHVCLYQKFGYWPQYLTAVLKKTPDGKGEPPLRFSTLDEASHEQALDQARQLTGRISPGLDLTAEIRSAPETVLVRNGDSLDAFAVCHTGAGTEGGTGLCYVKFAAARSAAAFEQILDAIEAFAQQNGASIEAGVNFAREDAYRRMHARGYMTAAQGVAMQRPHEPGFNRSGLYVIDDWR